MYPRFLITAVVLLLVFSASSWAGQDRADERAKAASALVERGLNYEKNNQWQQAIEAYSEALELYRAIGDRSWQATLLNNLGYVYDSIGEKGRALAYYQQSLALFSALQDARGEVNLFNNIGTIYDSMGEKRKALTYYEKVAAYARATGDGFIEAVTAINSGFAHKSLNDYQQALDNYNRALELFQALKNRAGEATARLNIGAVYNELGDRERALELFNKALTIFKAEGDRASEASALNNIALVYDYRGQPQEAIDYYTAALKIFREVGSRDGEATALTNIAGLLHLVGNYQSSLEHLEQALKIKQALRDRRDEALIFIAIARNLISLDKTEDALEPIYKARKLFQAIGDRRGEATALYAFARVGLAKGELADARNLIKEAVAIIESLRANVANIATRTAFVANTQDYYKLYIEILMASHRAAPGENYDAAALEVSERARARGLLDLLNEANAIIGEGVDPSLAARERELQESIAALTEYQIRLVNSKSSEEQAKAVDDELRALLSAQSELKAQIRKSSPRYAALTQPSPVTINELRRQILDDDTCLLEYSLGEKQSFLWVVTKTGLKSAVLAGRKEIEAAARSVHQLAATRVSIERDLTFPAEKRDAVEEQYERAARELSRLILSAALPHLKARRMIIVSEGALQFVPFAALPRPGTAEDTPLIVNYEIVHLPSASTLALLRAEKRAPAAKTLAVVADPVFSADDNRVKASAHNRVPEKADVRGLQLALSQKKADQAGADDDNLTIARLTGTRREAQKILAFVPPAMRKSATDFGANRALITSGELADYRIVHFATHGFLNTVRPELSGLILSLVDAQGRPQNGFVTVPDIFNLKLSAELVALSACQTGLGAEIRGEGLSGLSRGFLYAGAKRVVVSLWNVNDAATAELMVRFYEKMLVEKLAPAAALRAAQLSMWRQKRWRHPYYWAAFQLQGDW